MLIPNLRATVAKLQSMSKIFLALSLVACALAPVLMSTPLAAQTIIGRSPAESPYRDVQPSQHLTILGGYFHTQHDEIGATPRSGALFGLRYDLPVSGPAEFYARGQRVSSHRLAFDPTLPSASRSLGDQSVPLYIVDLGFALNLTGQKSWHGIIPVIGFGLGVASASEPSTAGKDPYKFGTQFAITTDAGLRIVPGNSFELRLMVGNTLYQNHYPAGYYVTPIAGTAPLLTANTSRSGYRANLSYTAGLAVPLFR